MNEDRISEIREILRTLGGKVNWQDGTYHAEDLLENAKEINILLEEYLKLIK